jgi:hypothetical protein
MMKTKLYARTSALPAIFAALALSSTPVWAQAAQPVPTDPPPVASTQPAPTAPDPVPVTADSSPSTDSVAAPATETKTAKTVTTKTSKRTQAAKSTPVTTTTTKRTVTTRPTVPAIASISTTTTTTKPVAINSRPQPVVNLNAKPVTPAVTTAAAKPHKKNDALPIAAGGALAFLALGGAAVAIKRRRDEDEWTDDMVDEQPVDTTVAETRPNPIVHDEQPTIIAPSAFAWNPKAAATDNESHVERAYRGPTPSNPSLSLRKRLKRAAFMDKREREAAAGLAVPVETTAGLPERMVDEDRRERELA